MFLNMKFPFEGKPCLRATISTLMSHIFSPKSRQIPTHIRNPRFDPVKHV